MEIINNPKVKFNKDERQLFDNLTEFITNFNKNFCDRYCENCPYEQMCKDVFAECPYSDVEKIISFFEDIANQED